MLLSNTRKLAGEKNWKKQKIVKKLKNKKMKNQLQNEKKNYLNIIISFIFESNLKENSKKKFPKILKKNRYKR